MASSSSSSSSWAELPSELMYSIMLRLDMVDILHRAQKVCTSWRRVSKDPSLWRKIDMRDLDLSSICRFAVDRSEGCLVDIHFGNICNDSLLNYVADRSSNLRRLVLDMLYSYVMTNEGLVNAVAKLPLLEEFQVSSSGITLDLKAIGHSCPRLRTFKLSYIGNWLSRDESDDDGDALAIAESMTELRHLELPGNSLTDTGLTAILDNCPHLEHLDLRYCYNVNLMGNLEKRCSEMIKCFRPPKVVYSDYVDDYYIYGYNDFEEDYDFDR